MVLLDDGFADVEAKAKSCICTPRVAEYLGALYAVEALPDFCLFIGKEPGSLVLHRNASVFLIFTHRNPDGLFLRLVLQGIGEVVSQNLVDALGVSVDSGCSCGRKVESDRSVGR